jgi:hypothetical protein
MKLKLRDYTAPASGECVFRSKSLADRAFKGVGLFGETKLCLVRNNQGTHVMWANVTPYFVAFLPVFLEDFKLNPPLNNEFVPIEKSILVYREYRGGLGACYLVLFGSDEILFTQIKMLPDQMMVEKYCEAQGLKVTHISICKMMTIQDHRYVITCWSVEYEKPEEPDEDGEPSQYVTYVPVDFAESEKLRDASLSKLNEEYLHENDVFVAQKTIYRVLKDEEGKYYISKELFPRPKEKTREVIRMKNDEAEKRICKIVQLRQH